jgi:hypothetical protein
VVINDFDILGGAVSPSEANAPLVVYADAVLALASTSKSLEPVSGRHAKVVEASGNLELA